jgi:hypothetical protein
MDQDYAASRQREGRSFGTHVDYMFAARTDTLKFLRKRSRPLTSIEQKMRFGRTRLIASSMRMWPNGRKASRSNHKLEGASALERTEGIMSEVRPRLALGVTGFILHITGRRGTRSDGLDWRAVGGNPSGGRASADAQSRRDLRQISDRSPKEAAELRELRRVRTASSPDTSRSFGRAISSPPSGPASSTAAAMLPNLRHNVA